MTFKRRMVCCNVLSMVTGALYVGYAMRSGGAPVVRAGIVWHVSSLGLLLVATVLLLRGSLTAPRVLMLIGGVGSLPTGLVALVGAVWRPPRRVGESTDDGLEPRCLRCGYSLRGLTVPVCPECACPRGFVRNVTELGMTEQELQRMRSQGQDVPPLDTKG